MAVRSTCFANRSSLPSRGSRGKSDGKDVRTAARGSTDQLNREVCGKNRRPSRRQKHGGTLLGYFSTLEANGARRGLPRPRRREAGDRSLLAAVPPGFVMRSATTPGRRCLAWLCWRARGSLWMPSSIFATADPSAGFAASLACSNYCTAAADMHPKSVGLVTYQCPSQQCRPLVRPSWSPAASWRRVGALDPNATWPSQPVPISRRSRLRLLFPCFPPPSNSIAAAPRRARDPTTETTRRQLKPVYRVSVPRPGALSQTPSRCV